MSQVEVKGIGISVGGQDVLLSVEDARALQKELNDLFGTLADWVRVSPWPPLVIIPKTVWPHWEPMWTSSGTGDAMPNLPARAWCSTEAPQSP